MKVLVIEDKPQIRDIFAEFVELLGHEAEVAVDGRDGLALNARPQIGDADFLMPGRRDPRLPRSYGRGAARRRSC